MGDLISRKTLLKELDKLDHWTQFAEHWYNCESVYSLIRRQPAVKQGEEMRLIDADKIKPEDFYDRVDMEECMEVISEQPTAYDVEAVIKELFNSAQSIYGTNIIRMEDAIEIVKRGGRRE